jgi:cytochrome d ubiquinol oxidase subunit II
VHLATVPLLFVLAGLAFYATLGGADFGAGFWQLTAGRGPRAERIRELAHHAMGPVWEANHVWLIFVLTVTWTAYPRFFGSIASTLSIPLFVAGIGIVLRGAAYALRSGTSGPREQRLVDTVFSISSVLTPFALGTTVGAIAAGRVPVGNAAGSLLSSWTSPLSFAAGVLAVAFSAYMAAVFLCGDAARQGEPGLEADFRRRALGSGVVAGAVAAAALIALRYDAHPLFHRLLTGRGLPALAVSVAAGLLTLVLVWRRRYEPARYTAALAVAAVLAGWALAQSPTLLPGLTVSQAAASHDSLVAVIVAVLGGGAILFPSLALLFMLVLRGTFDPVLATEVRPTGRLVLAASTTRPLLRLAVALLIVGVGLLTVAEASWAHAIGVVSLLGFLVVAFPVALPPDVVTAGDGSAEP